MCPTKFTKNRIICPTDVSDKNEKKLQDIQDTITTSKRLELLLNQLIPIIHPFYSTHNTIHLEVVPHRVYVSNYMLRDKSNVHACA